MTDVKLLVMALGFGVSVPALAQTTNGDTTGQPRFNRPEPVPTPSPSPVPTSTPTPTVTLTDTVPTSLSDDATAVPYQANRFVVSQTGIYTVTTTTATPSYDGFLSLYRNSFDPNAPLANGIISNDHPVAPYENVMARITVELASNTDYVLVQSGYSNDDFGSYTVTISGAGVATFVSDTPEPASWALMIVGFGIAGTALRRRTRTDDAVATPADLLAGRRAAPRRHNAQYMSHRGVVA